MLHIAYENDLWTHYHLFLIDGFIYKVDDLGFRKSDVGCVQDYVEQVWDYKAYAASRDHERRRREIEQRIHGLRPSSDSRASSSSEPFACEASEREHQLPHNSSRQQYNLSDGSTFTVYRTDQYDSELLSGCERPTALGREGQVIHLYRSSFAPVRTFRPPRDCEEGTEPCHRLEVENEVWEYEFEFVVTGTYRGTWAYRGRRRS